MIRKTVSTIACLAAMAAGCSSTSNPPKPLGGLMLVMDVDPSAAALHPDRLDVVVSSGGQTLRDAGYAIDQPDATMNVTFPTTLFIASNNDPTATVAIDLGLWDAQGPIDVREYDVTDIPGDRVAMLKVIFDAHDCVPETPASQPPCTSMLKASDLPTFGTDAGPAPFMMHEAGPAESGGADASEGGAADATLADANVQDALTESGEVSLLDASDAGQADAPSPPAPPCDPACVEGHTHCVDHTCVPVPPSCLGAGVGAGMNCGGSNGTDDCCATLHVPLDAGETFLRDYDHVASTGNSDTSHPATVSQFRLDEYEVTVGRFRKFVDAVVGGDAAAPWVPPSGSGKHTHLNGGKGLVSVTDAGTTYETGWDSSWNTYLPTTKAAWDTALLDSRCDGPFPPMNTWTPTSGPDENLPISCPTWFHSYAFCIWDGGFLPSRTEFDFAAAGGSDQRVYPWGDFPLTPDYADYQCYYGSGIPFGNNCYGGVSLIAPVGSFPKGRGRWGQLDLAGNMYEWNVDYQIVGYQTPCVDCAATVTATDVLNLAPPPSTLGKPFISGGGWDCSDYQIEASYALISRPASLHADVGVRCARVP